MATAQTNFSQTEQNYVWSLIQDQKRIYREYQSITLQLRRLRALRIDTRTPRAFQRLVGRGVRVPLSWSLVQTINGMITKGEPLFSRTSLTPGGKAQAQNLADTCWPLVQTYSAIAKKDLYYQSCDALTGDGRVIGKLQRKTFEDYPKRVLTASGEPVQSDREYNGLVEQWLAAKMTDGGSPFKLTLVDARTFMPDRSDEPAFVMESGRKALLPTLQTLGLKQAPDGTLQQVPEGQTLSEWALPSGLMNAVMMDEIWTKEAAYYNIGGQLVKVDNELGFIPYAYRSGMSTAIPDPVLEAVSAMFPFYGMEPHLNTLMTSMLAWAVLAGMPTAVVSTAPNAQVSSNTEIPPTDLPLGQMITLAQGKTMQYLTPPPAGREMAEVVNLMMSIYDRAGVTQAARGIIGARTPGLTFTSALEAAGDMVNPIKTGLEGFWEDVVRMTWKGIEKVNMPMMVTGETLVEGKQQKQRSQHIIKPAQIRGYYDIHCDISPQSTQDTIQKGMHAAFMNAHQLWSKDRAMTFSGVDNTEAERIELLKDQIRSSPFYLQQVEQRIVQGEPDLQGSLQAAQQQGVDLLTAANPDFGQVTGEVGPGGQRSEGIFGGAPQPRGLPAPGAGGAPQGRPRRPTGPRPVAQGSQFPKP